MAIEIPRGPIDSATAAARPGPIEAEGGFAGSFAALSRREKPVGARERMFFTERLSLLLATGTPLHTALETLARQAGAGPLATLSNDVRERVSSGATFAQALGHHPDAFPITYVNLIAAAERGGFLPTALESLRDMEENREELRSAMTSALSYPAVLTVFSLAVIVFVLVVVFPKFEEIFETIRDQLPITTRWLLAASHVLREWWMPLGIGTALALQWGSTAMRRPSGAEWLDGVLLRVPGLRTIVVQLNVVQLLRVLGLSLENGVPMVEALRSARHSVSSSRFRAFVGEVERSVQEGRGLSAAFQREPLLPDLVKQLVSTGEESGQLPMVMARLADFYEREWRRALGMIAKVAEPAMLVIMGGVVGLIVSSLILPIFKLSRAVH